MNLLRIVQIALVAVIALGFYITVFPLAAPTFLLYKGGEIAGIGIVCIFVVSYISRVARQPTTPKQETFS